MKKCTVCKELLGINEFSKDKKSKDGHVSRCKKCTKAYAAEYYKKNQERLKAANKKWRDENPEKFEASRLSYEERNRETILRKKRDAYRAKKEIKQNGN